jgi:hypothetical protein
MIFGRIVCLFKGHRRGKEADLKGDGYSDDRRVLQARGAGMRLLRCPRCGHETRYKVKQPKIVTDDNPPASITVAQANAEYIAKRKV